MTIAIVTVAMATPIATPIAILTGSIVISAAVEKMVLKVIGTVLALSESLAMLVDLLRGRRVCTVKEMQETRAMRIGSFRQGLKSIGRGRNWKHGSQPEGAARTYISDVKRLNFFV